MTNNPIKFYRDTPHACSYLDDQQACNIYPDPEQPMTSHLYSHLIKHGFRRSGDLVYRPYCSDCQACVPVRINIEQFKASGSQRRCLQRNKHLNMRYHPATFNPEHYQLYCRYLTSRHIGGGMDNPTEETYLKFLTSNWTDPLFIEFRDNSQLIAVAVTDTVDHALSALYTFFDPDLARNSLGTYAILQQINIAQQHDLPYLYLGYWIENCRKMEYKQKFSGLEAYINQQWQPLKV